MLAAPDISSALVVRRAIALLAAALLAACQSATDPDWVVETGIIIPEMSSVQTLQAPAMARAGEPFTIVVSTRGSSTCTAAAGAHVRMSGSVIEVTPRDSIARGRGCTDDLAGFPRPITLTIAEQGNYTIRVSGRPTRSG